MAFKSAPKLVPLSNVEIITYWVLSLGSHLYSFYHLHKFSKEHEAGLEKEYLLEKGTIFKGYKKDSNDFEWSLWSDCAKKYFLWTLTGHAVVSKLANTIFPKFRTVVLSVYGVLAACSVLGFKGLAVVLTHLTLSFAVAQLRRPAVTWFCATLLLSTLQIPELQVLQRSWYDTEEEYYLLLFCLAVCGLRFISFSLEHCWHPQESGGLSQLGWLVAYSFYHPLFYNGPIILYKDYLQQIQRAPEGNDSGCKALLWMSKAGRVLLWWLIAEYMIHSMYMHCIQANQTYLEMLPPWALGGLALALVQFFYVKYLVLFGLPSMLATLDGLVPPKLPRCVSIMYSFTGMWRYFDEGLYCWLIRYIYVPLGGSRHGPLRKVLSTGIAFGFVCLWHGGHDYLRYWALMNWAGVLVENASKTLLTSSYVYPFIESRLSAMVRRRCVALLHAFSTAMLILSNLVFLGGTHVGLVFWERVFVRGWYTVAPPMLAFLYCFAQIGMEWTPETP